MRVSAGRSTHELTPGRRRAPGRNHQAAIERGVVAILERLRQNNAEHHYYPPDTIHATIRKLGHFVPDHPDGVGRLGELRHIAGSHPSFDLSMWGLNLSPTTVFAQVLAWTMDAGARGALSKVVSVAETVATPRKLAEVGRSKVQGIGRGPWSIPHPGFRKR